MGSAKPKKQRWYLGGFAGAGAVLFTHPLDLLKVREAKYFCILFFLLVNTCTKSATKDTGKIPAQNL